ncbi:hypothetical protein OAO41_06515 [Euryarchaeota archaeon]|nr:hypothetical protein [Euryarchaeota archaeon]
MSKTAEDLFFLLIVFVIIMIYVEGGVECCLLVSFGLVVVVVGMNSKEERGGYSKSTVDIDGDGSISDEEWADFEKNADVFEPSSLKLNKNQSQTEMSNNYGKVGSKCTELDCKGTVMYKSKFCYKHRNLK